MLCITACSLGQPFIDRRRNAGAVDKNHLYVGQSTPDRPAVCYNGLWTSEEELQTLADAECQKHHPGTHAKKIDDSSFSCRLFLPSRAYYKCISTDKD